MGFFKKNKDRNVIILNGAHYDADTGEFVDEHPSPEKPVETEATVPVAQPRPIDGLRHHPEAAQQAPKQESLNKPERVKAHPVQPQYAKKMPVNLHTSSPQATQSAQTPKPTKEHQSKKAHDLHSRQHQTPATIRGRKRRNDAHSRIAEQAAVRGAVSALQQSQRRRLNRTDHKQPAGYSAQAARNFRAAQVKKSKHINKFGTLSSEGAGSENHAAAEPVTQTVFRPLPTARKQNQAQANEQALYHPRRYNLEQIAEPVTQPKQKSKGRLFSKLAPLLATFASIIVVAGYVLYLNIPNLAINIAGNRSGVTADMPAYVPDGFSFEGPVTYAAGQVTVGFGSNSDDRKFVLTQRESNWDSESLRENFVRAQSDNFTTVTEQGLTIYVFNESEATWVNKGVWYSIQGESHLNREQIVSIATSL